MQLNYLLHLPSTPPEKRADVASRLRDVIVDLAVSLGLERATILQQVCAGAAVALCACRGQLPRCWNPRGQGVCLLVLTESEDTPRSCFDPVLI